MDLTKRQKSYDNNLPYDASLYVLKNKEGRMLLPIIKQKTKPIMTLITIGFYEFFEKLLARNDHDSLRIIHELLPFEEPKEQKSNQQ